MTEYTFTKTINTDKLNNELKVAFTKFNYISCLGTALSVFMNEALTEEEETSLNTLITNHTTTDMPVYIKNKILSAMTFGQGLMAEYGASNVLNGMTTAQVQEIMVITAKVQSALSSGSLYVALTEIAAITPDEVIVTQALLDDARHKIQDYLGIART